MGSIEISYPIAALDFASQQITSLMNEASTMHLPEIHSLVNELSKLPGFASGHFLSDEVTSACNQWDIHVQEFYNLYSALGSAISKGSTQMQQYDQNTANSFNKSTFA
jgi:uncharacterized protein YukE